MQFTRKRKIKYIMFFFTFFLFSEYLPGRGGGRVQ